MGSTAPQHYGMTKSPCTRGFWSAAAFAQSFRHPWPVLFNIGTTASVHERSLKDGRLNAAEDGGGEGESKANDEQVEQGRNPEFEALPRRQSRQIVQIERQQPERVDVRQRREYRDCQSDPGGTPGAPQSSLDLVRVGPRFWFCLPKLRNRLGGREIRIDLTASGGATRPAAVFFHSNASATRGTFPSRLVSRRRSTGSVRRDVACVMFEVPIRALGFIVIGKRIPQLGKDFLGTIGVVFTDE